MNIVVSVNVVTIEIVITANIKFLDNGDLQCISVTI